MAIKFDKVYQQVQTMGQYAAHRTEDTSERGLLALKRFDAASDLDEIRRKIELVRNKDAGYRGAAPLQEGINQSFPAPAPPQQAITVAVDGSQIYPDPHAAALYYLTNISYFVYWHGFFDSLPYGDSEPHLYYADSDLREKGGHGSIIKNNAVNARRTVQEMHVLYEVCWEHREQTPPIIGMRDGPLLWWLSDDIPYAVRLEEEYHHYLREFHALNAERQAANINLIGYVDSGDSRFVVRLLHLLGLDDDEITRAELDTAGPFEGLTDGWLFSRILQPQERSAVMIQQSPANKRYGEKMGEQYEIAFFYLNVGMHNKPHVVRIELPIWAAQIPQAVDHIHSVVLSDCAIAGGFPYTLTRADELAVVKSFDKRQLAELINVELLKNKQSVEKSPKQIGKDLARQGRTRYGQPVKH